MVGVVNQKVSLGQANGPDIELIVSGTELYATYETPEGFPAIYDDARGLFCYARVVDGEFQSTGVPVTSEPPSDVERHASESDEIRNEKIRKRILERERRSGRPPEHK
jgi:hypothetical protein